MTLDLFKRKVYEKFYKWRVQRLRPKTIKKLENPNLIVSLTTFPKRFSVVHIAIRGILLQSVLPDRLICYLGSDCTPDVLTEEMKELEQYGVEYRFVEGNLKPHKKYLYAVQEFPDATIITIDDDVIYDRKMIESLVICSKKHPQCICARRVHKIKVDYKNRKFMKYCDWEYEYIPESDEESMTFFPTGVGGVLYPPHSLHMDAFNVEKIKEQCLNADDIWLKIMSIRNHTNVVAVKCYYPHPVIVDDSQEFALNSQNVSFGANDKYWDSLVKYYNIDIDDVMDK